MSRTLSIVIAATLVSLSLFAFLVIWFSTPWGIGTTPDSIQYLQNARSLEEGKSFLSWDRHWPPVYPLFIWLVSQFTVDELQAARLLQAVLFGANVLLLACCVLHSGPRRRLAAVTGALYFVLLIDSYAIHYMVWSEALFVLLLLFQIFLLQCHLQTNKVWQVLLAGVFVGLAVLVRYAGLAFLVASSLFLLTISGHWTVRLRRALLFVVGGAVLPAIWLIASGMAISGSAPRKFAIHPLDGERLLDAFITILGWFQENVLGIGSIGILGATLVLVIIACVTDRDSDDRMMQNSCRLLVISIVVYLAFLVLSISFFDYSTPLDKRILWPVFPLVIIAMVLSAQLILRQRKWFILVCWAMILLAGLGLPNYVQVLQYATREGVGYYAPHVRMMPVLRFVAAKEPKVIYTNAPELLRVHVGGDPRFLPAFVDTSTNRPRAGYDAEMDVVINQVYAGEAIVVYLDSFIQRSYLPDHSVFDRQKGLSKIYHGVDGVVYSRSEL